MMHVKLYNCRLEDLDSIYHLSQTLAQYFPTPDEYVTAIYELVLNAIEHGNLSLGFDAKTDLIRRGIWKDEINRRLNLPENADKVIDISLAYNDTECRLTIKDQGHGFAWERFITNSPDNLRPNGRGLYLVFNSNFDHIFYNAVGNQVTCVAEKQNSTNAFPHNLEDAAG